MVCENNLWSKIFQYICIQIIYILTYINILIFLIDEMLLVKRRKLRKPFKVSIAFIPQTIFIKEKNPLKALTKICLKAKHDWFTIFLIMTSVDNRNVAKQ